MSDTATYSSAGISVQRSGFWNHKIWRSFFRFDLSALPSKTVKYAALHIYYDWHHDTYVSVQKGTQHSPMILGDYSAFTGIGFGATEWIAGDNVLILDSAGRSFVQSCLGSPSAKFCLREYLYDYLYVQPPAGDWLNGCKYRNHPTQSVRPILVIGV
jgi:hypothetical protein